MSKLIAFLGLLAAIVALPANSFAMPVPANAEFRLNHGLSGGSGVMLGYQVISNKVQLLKCKYDFAVQGGATTAAIKLKAVDGSDCKLPSKAIVKDSLIDVITAPTSDGLATIAIGTGQAANDIKAATAIASYTGLVAGVPVGDASHSIKMTADRNPTMTIAVAALTTGKFNVFLEYLLSE